MQRLAIFGGTFNPIHWGHLIMAETALSQFALTQVIWVPAYSPGYKATMKIAAFSHRTQMLQLATASHPKFCISTIEQEQPTPSHAIDTFLGLRSLDPTAQWYWIIGLDAFQSLPRWYRQQEWVSQCKWLVAPRWSSTGEKENSLYQCLEVVRQIESPAVALEWHLLDMPFVGIASSLIRQYCHTGRSLRYLVPDPVRAYIHQHHLYQ